MLLIAANHLFFNNQPIRELSLCELVTKLLKLEQFDLKRI